MNLEQAQFEIEALHRRLTEYQAENERLRGALSNTVMLCERYQNADIEGCDPDALVADGERTVNAICKEASDALAKAR